jgi:UDPglucose--hexose-1-phosphate uridylyltransferase
MCCPETIGPRPVTQKANTNDNTVVRVPDSTAHLEGAAADGAALGRTDLRRDPLTGARVVVVQARQDRPNLPSSGCPFCPGGLEAPDTYDVRWFKNRWPPLPDGRCEVVLFSPEHSQSLGSLDHQQLKRVVSLWTERSQALGARDDVRYVLIFENRGHDVGATIAHPHGQIYAFTEVPPVPVAELANDQCAICDELNGKGDAGTSHTRRVIAEAAGWQAWTVWAPSYPFELLIAPQQHIGSLAEASPVHDGLADILRSSLSALDALFSAPMPYMFWCHQRPTDGRPWPSAHLHFHVAPTLRAKGVARYVASGELGSGVMFNPVGPDDAAQRLRRLVPGR